MPDPKSLVSALWLASSLALLASVLDVPIRASRFVTISPRPDSFRRDLAPPPAQPANRFSAAKATDAVLQMNALPSENEEQDRADALDEPQASFLIPCSFRKIFDRHLIAPRSIPSLYPLRC